MSVQRELEAGQLLHQAGRFAEAEQTYRQILAKEPTHPGALHLTGLLAAQTRRLDAALDFFHRSIASCPTNAVVHNDFGMALLAKRRIDNAIASFQRAIELLPSNADFHVNLGNAHRAGGSLDQAIAAYRRAISLKPDHAYAYNNLGVVLAAMDKLEEAEAALRHVNRLNPDYAEAYANLGKVLHSRQKPGEAIELYRHAIRLKSELVAAHIDLGNALKDTGRLDEAITSFRQAMKLRPDYELPHGNLIFTLQYHSACTSQMIYEEARRWDKKFAELHKGGIQVHGNDHDPQRRLRIGYISADFREHCQSLFTIPLLSNHDHGTFEIFCYANVGNPDPTTEKIRRHADHWRSIAGMSDDEAVRKIREDRIDILVDLTMHMAGNRLLIFARKPAPVQVTWLAYPGTTGLSTMDYRLTDPFLDPPEANNQFYSETSIRLSDTFWCYDPLTTRPAVNPSPAESNGYVTFGCLNNFCKVNDQALQLWAQVLTAVADSRMLILCPEGSHRNRLLDLLQQIGVSPERIEFVTHVPRPQFLEFFRRIDVGLDTFPYNGHTTSLDSFWMGVPVVTLVGRTIVGRAGLSQLTNLGLPEFIAQTPQRYVEIAINLAKDLPQLVELRRDLRSRMKASPLMDAPRFARSVEAAYRQMWRNWCMQGG